MAQNFRKPSGIVTYHSYLDRQEKLQPEIEDMANNLKISREDNPKRWEQLVRLVVDEDFSVIFTGPLQFNFPVDEKPTFTSEELLEIVTINVGAAEDQKSYKIHKKFATYFSPIFKSAFTGSFIEAETQSIDLDDVDNEVFDLFVQWLYTQKLRKQDKKLPRADLLIKLWVLADRLMVRKLQNNTICAIEEKVMKEDLVVRTDQVNYIYENTLPGSPLRRLIVDQCSNLNHESFALHRPIEDYPKEMLFDLVTVLLKRRNNNIQPIVDMTQFFVDVAKSVPLSNERGDTKDSVENVPNQ